MFEVHIYIATTSNSPKVSERLYGYVLECIGKSQTREGFGKITATYHKTILTAMIEALERINQSCEVHIHTEDVFVLNMLQNNAAIWAENGYINKKGGTIANREEWEKLWSLTTKHTIIPKPGHHAFIQWIQNNAESGLLKNPSHSGKIRRNEEKERSDGEGKELDS